MTHREYQAFWRELCEAYSTPKRERTERQKTLTQCGLCDAVYCNIDRYEDRIVMYGRIEIFYNNYLWYWAKKQTRLSDRHRSIAAGLLAAMSARDVKEFLK